MGRLEIEVPALPPAALHALKAMLRINRADEDGVLIGHLRAALDLCEAFTGQLAIARTVVETLPVSRDWTPLTAWPVEAITAVDGVPAEGAVFALAPTGYAIDLDSSGEGRVRILAPGSAGCVRVTYRAGLASGWSDLPEALRLGVLRLAAHGFADAQAGADARPPAAVAALWRPWRRVRIG